MSTYYNPASVPRYRYNAVYTKRPKFDIVWEFLGRCMKGDFFERVCICSEQEELEDCCCTCPRPWRFRLPIPATTTLSFSDPIKPGEPGYEEAEYEVGYIWNRPATQYAGQCLLVKDNHPI